MCGLIAFFAAGAAMLPPESFARALDRMDAHLLRQLQPVMAAFGRHPGKRLLAGAPARALPAEIAGRGKTRFGISVGRWLARGPGVSRSGGGSRAWTREVVNAYHGASA